MAKSTAAKKSKQCMAHMPGVSEDIGLYNYPTGAGASGKHKVTISVSKPLINAVNDYADKSGNNTSSVVEEALLMWCKWQQEQVDFAYYSSLTDADKAADESWKKVTTEAAKHIWKK